MSIYSKWTVAMDNQDAEGVIACLHENYEFIRHQSGTRMNKTEVGDMMRQFMSSDAVHIRDRRCLYENDEVMIEHSVMDFADGTREAVLAFYRIEDGLIISCETGATPIKS